MLSDMAYVIGFTFLLVQIIKSFFRPAKVIIPLLAIFIAVGLTLLFTVLPMILPEWATAAIDKGMIAALGATGMYAIGKSSIENQSMDEYDDYYLDDDDDEDAASPASVTITPIDIADPTS